MAEDIFSHCFVCLFFGSLWKCFEFGAEIICSEKAWWSVIGSLKGIGKRISCFILAARFSIKFLSQSLAAIPWRLPLGPHRYARLLAVALLKYVSLIDECVDTVLILYVFNCFHFFPLKPIFHDICRQSCLGVFVASILNFRLPSQSFSSFFVWGGAKMSVPKFNTTWNVWVCTCDSCPADIRRVEDDSDWFWIWFWMRMV